jgi:hypothetical protein
VTLSPLYKKRISGENVVRSPLSESYQKRKGLCEQDITAFLKEVAFETVFSIGTPEVTVGLPVFNSDDICWLAMESLCRQQTTKKWELVIFDESLGKEYFLDYQDALKKAGCVSMKYACEDIRFPLAIKWVNIAGVSEGSILLLQAADCYSPAKRIQDTPESDWSHSCTGLFYNIATKQRMLFSNADCLTGLDMAIRTSLVKQMPKEAVWKGVDGWLLRQGQKLKEDFKITITEFVGGVDTDGMNNISFGRRKNYDNPQPPFYTTSIQLEYVVPEDIAERLKAL